MILLLKMPWAFNVLNAYGIPILFWEKARGEGGVGHVIVLAAVGLAEREGGRVPVAEQPKGPFKQKEEHHRCGHGQQELLSEVVPASFHPPVLS